MARKKKFKSIGVYQNEVKRINDLMSGLMIVVKYFEKQMRDRNISVESEGIKEILSKYGFSDHTILEFTKEKIDNIYELGFIRLFASFESFMYEFLKELYIKYPKSLPTDRKIQISEILEWKTKKSVHDYIIDHLAIENSYDCIIWEKTLKNSFGIDVFQDEDERQLFGAFNLCRNMIAHSGGKTNSKILKEYKKIIKNSEVSQVEFKIEKWDIFDYNFFITFASASTYMINRIEKNA